MAIHVRWRRVVMGALLGCMPCMGVRAQNLPGLPPAPEAPVAPQAPSAPGATFQDDGVQTFGPQGNGSDPGAGTFMPSDPPGSNSLPPEAFGDGVQENQGQEPVDPPGRVGRARVISGQASVRPAGEKAWLDAVSNRPLTSGDALWVEAGGRAQVHVGSIALHVGPATLLRLTTVDDETLQVALSSGTLHVHLAEAPIHSLVEVDLAGMSATLLQAGDYMVTAGPRGAEALTVRLGRAEVMIDTDHLAVGTAQRLSHTAGGRRVRKLAPAGPAEAFETWATHDNVTQAAVPALRYVSADTVGYEDLDDHGVWEPDANYGTVWRPTQMAADWAPYRYGRWVNISPWGWTWVDDAPWGFAPFHYGRWVYSHAAWAWAPGNYVHRPIFAPHLVTFLGPQGASLGVGIGVGNGMVAWVPLGYGEAFMPGYQSSYTYMRGINGGHGPAIQGGRNWPAYANRGYPGAITAVPHGVMVGGRPVGGAQVALGPQTLRGNMFGAAGPGIAPNRQPPRWGGNAPPGARPPMMVQHPFAPGRFSPFMGRRGGQQIRSTSPIITRTQVPARTVSPMFRQGMPQGQMVHFTGPTAHHYEPNFVGHPVRPGVGHPAFNGHMGGPGYMGGGGHGPMVPMGRSRR